MRRDMQAGRLVDDNEAAIEERIGRNRQKLSFAEKQSLAQTIRDTEENNDPTKLPPEVRRQHEQRKMMLQHDDDNMARGDERDRLNARRKEIEAIITGKMCSKTEMWAKESNEHQRAVHKKLNYDQNPVAPNERTGIELEREWQSIMRKLEPDDDSAANLENIRPDR